VKKESRPKDRPCEMKELQAFFSRRNHRIQLLPSPACSPKFGRSVRDPAALPLVCPCRAPELPELPELPAIPE